MNYRNLALAILVFLTMLVSLHAQRGGGRGGNARGGTAQAAQAAAPVDLTGYWVALVTEDWRWRMVTPKKGDFPSIPLNNLGRDLANAWDPAKDEANGDQCKSYGAGNVMRLPARFHVTWADPNTLKIEVDYGTQTRLLHFGQNPPELTANPADAKNWQGNSVASWETAGGRGAARAGELKVVTTGARPGYLQKNGVPYSKDAVFTEYFSKYDEAGPTPWTLLVVSTLTEDPMYLQQPHIRSSHYKRLPDATGWNPTPCTAK